MPFSIRGRSFERPLGGGASLRWAVLFLLCLSTSTASAAVWPSLQAKAAAHRTGRHDAAVIVAIEDYAHVPDIAGARRNAMAWHRWFVGSRGLRAAHTHLLVDRRATRAQILRSLKAAAGEVRRDGTLWFIFIGHGAATRRAGRNEGLLVGYNAQPNAQSVQDESITRTELVRALKSSRGKHSVGIIDACFSGRLRDGRRRVFGDVLPLIPVAALRSRGKLVLLTAAGADQFAGMLPGAARPAFSYLVLAGLRGWADRNRNGSVDAEEVVRYARDALAATGPAGHQTPQLSGRRHLVLVRGTRERGPDLARIARALHRRQQRRGPPVPKEYRSRRPPPVSSSRRWRRDPRKGASLLLHLAGFATPDPKVALAALDLMYTPDAVNYVGASLSGGSVEEGADIGALYITRAYWRHLFSKGKTLRPFLGASLAWFYHPDIRYTPDGYKLGVIAVDSGPGALLDAGLVVDFAKHVGIWLHIVAGYAAIAGSRCINDPRLGGVKPCYETSGRLFGAVGFGFHVRIPAE